MEHEVFTKKGDKHVASPHGFEVKWDSQEFITYIEPPRQMGFSFEGYWGNDGIWQYDIFVPAEPKWWPPHNSETLSQDHLALIKANLVRALQSLYPGVPFELREK